MTTEALTSPFQSPTALEVINLCKSFGALRVLDNISFRLQRGSFHALLGGNGAGKSTLVKCIMGYYHADEGNVLIDNHEREINNTRDAHQHGLGMVYQHFTLVPEMTVLENLVLSRSPIPKIINWQKEKHHLETLMAETPFEIPLHKKASALAAGEKQKVEILKQLFLQPEILILDEPTSVLTPQEADEILDMLKEWTRSKNLSVLIITHKFREVMNFADDVSVLRRGKLAYSGPLAEKTPAMLAELMVGNEEIASTGARELVLKGDIRLDIHQLVASNDSGAVAVDGISLQLHGGEILGIAGVSGNGQRELVQVLSGQRLPNSGDIRVCGEPYTASRAQMARHKLYCLPEEPLRNACVPRMNLVENLALRIFDQPRYTRWRWFLNRQALKAHALKLIDRYHVRPPEPERWIETLSGGNVQRLVLAREISGEVDLLITANPCFGLDFAATAEIRRQLMDARNSGVAVLLVSEDLDELLELSDRIAVIFEGQLRYEAPIAQANMDEMGLKMAGH
ncbi:MAG: ABC transporter ATP-binding protein [Methylovulum miyakonense]|uniref:ABC transporter ATP-binding protein n=1 Tax=Methylovulum miyakonense TaxID=645578 RepID=UPI003BB5C30A